MTVALPSIPPRAAGGMLNRALASVWAQTRLPDAVAVAADTRRAGAPATRDAALGMVETELTAFLDDDDRLFPVHLELLAAELARTGADLVYPWYEVHGGTDPHARWEGVPWDDARPHQVPVTFLARTQAIRAAGGFSAAWDPSQGEDPGTDAHGNRAGEDYRLILRLAAAGAKIVHLPARTWVWNHHGANTMGLPSRW